MPIPLDLTSKRVHPARIRAAPATADTSDPAASSEHCRVDAGVAVHLFSLLLDVFLGTLGGDDVLVAEDEERRVLAVVGVDVLQSPA